MNRTRINSKKDFLQGILKGTVARLEKDPNNQHLTTYIPQLTVRTDTKQEVVETFDTTGTRTGEKVRYVSAGFELLLSGLPIATAKKDLYTRMLDALETLHSHHNQGLDYLLSNNTDYILMVFARVHKVSPLDSYLVFPAFGMQIPITFRPAPNARPYQLGLAYTHNTRYSNGVISGDYFWEARLKDAEPYHAPQ